MKIGFFAQGCLPIHARTLEERPLGGTETGLIRVAEKLAKRGHQVFVFTTHNNPPQSNPVYLPLQALTQVGDLDVFVAVKEWRSAFYPHRAKKVAFWTGDGPEQYSTLGLGDARVEQRYDRILCVSNWHRSALAESSGVSPDKIAVIGNGIEPSYFAGEEVRQRKRLIYTAAPYRGLQLLPAIFQALKVRHQELELHVFSGMNIYDTDRPFEGPQNQAYAQIAAQLKTLPGVHLHGNVRQRELAREYMKSAVFAYPNVILETCCITAIEAQAGGCPVVASAISALPETVGEAGFVIPGKPGSEQYMRDFTLALDQLLSDDVLWAERSLRALERAEREFSWEHVVDRFLAALV